MTTARRRKAKPTAPEPLPGQPRWTEYLPLPELQRAPRNPKGHDDRLISESMARHGFVEQPTIDQRTGRLVAGHGRLDFLEAAHAAGAAPPDGILVDDHGVWLVPVQGGWSSVDDAQAENYLLVSNRGTMAGGWLDAELAEILAGKLEDPDGLVGSGFTRDEAVDLVEAAQHDPDRSTGSLLSLADVTVGEPTHEVHHGEHYVLGRRHHLVIAKVLDEWDRWAHLLVGDALFVPYPGVYIPLTSTAGERVMVLVQPNQYLAGHLLDKWAGVHGDDAIEQRHS